MNANELIENARKIIGKPLGELRAFQLLPQIQLSADMLRQQQRTIDGDKRLIDLLYEKITKYELRHAEQRMRIEQLEHMMEKASHYEAMAHAGGFEAGYQAAQANFNKENPVKEVFNRKAQEK